MSWLSHLICGHKPEVATIELPHRAYNKEHPILLCWLSMISLVDDCSVFWCFFFFGDQQNNANFCNGTCFGFGQSPNKCADFKCFVFWICCARTKERSLLMFNVFKCQIIYSYDSVAYIEIVRYSYNIFKVGQKIRNFGFTLRAVVCVDMH